MAKFVVSGFFRRTHGGMACMPWPEPFKSIPIEAGSAKEAIEDLFAEMQTDFKEQERVYREELADKDDLSPEEEDKLTETALAMEPIEREKWTAKEVQPAPAAA